jgi:hypothetical protein
MKKSFKLLLALMTFLPSFGAALPLQNPLQQESLRSKTQTPPQPDEEMSDVYCPVDRDVYDRLSRRAKHLDEYCVRPEYNDPDLRLKPRGIDRHGVDTVI